MSDTKNVATVMEAMKQIVDIQRNTLSERLPNLALDMTLEGICDTTLLVKKLRKPKK